MPEAVVGDAVAGRIRRLQRQRGGQESAPVWGLQLLLPHRRAVVEFHADEVAVGAPVGRAGGRGRQTKVIIISLCIIPVMMELSQARGPEARELESRLGGFDKLEPMELPGSNRLD